MMENELDFDKLQLENKILRMEKRMKALESSLDWLYDYLADTAGSVEFEDEMKKILKLLNERYESK